MRKISYLLVILVLVCTSCKKSIQEFVQPNASGTPYDLYIVMDDALKNTPLQDTLNAVFEYPMECTPNGDAYFRVRYITPQSFSSKVIRIVGNVVTINLDPTNASTPIISMERNRYARSQVIVKMSAQHPDSLAQAVSQLQTSLRDVFVKAELNRRIAILEKEHNSTQGDRLMQLQNVAMYIPEELRIPGVGLNDSTFFWATDNGLRKESHLIVYSIPYTDANVFTLEGAVAVRDSVMRANIEGGGAGSFMTTNKKIILPEYKALNIGGRYIGELRGMWRIENGLMAGPFICHIRLDELNQRVVFAEGFCYAPEDGKRLLIRNLEAAIYTLQLPSDNMISNIEITLDNNE